MTRITIEIADSGAIVSQQSSGQQQPTAESGIHFSGAPTELLARAAVLGANNGGPAPSLEASSSESLPIPFTSSGTSDQPGIASLSAGAARETV